MTDGTSSNQTEPSTPQQNINVSVTTRASAALAPKSVGVGYLLLIFLGVLGVHQFYLGKIGRGILYLLTGGVFLIGVVIDLFTLPSQVKTINARRAVGIS